MVAMRNALIKDSFREIRRTLSRFLSIFAIVAIGVSFFAGVKATDPDMKITADKYFDDYHLMDIRLVSTIGFNEDDLIAVGKVSGIDGIFPTYSMDVLANVRDQDLVLKILALPVKKLDNPDGSYINRARLVEGRFPENPGECVAEKGKIINSGLSIGSRIKLSSGNDKDINKSLKISEYTIVGIVETPYYISFERGTSSIGNGKVNSFIMIPQEDFKIPVYTDIFLTVKGASNVLCYDSKYDKIIGPVKKEIEEIAELREQIRYNEIVNSANKELDESRREIADAETKQKRELANAAEKLDYSRNQIVKGEWELKNKEEKFNNTIKQSEAKIADGYDRLQGGEKEYSSQLKSFNGAKKQADIEFPAAQQRIDAAQSEIDKNEAELNKMKSALGQDLPDMQREQLEESIKAGEQQLMFAQSQLLAAKNELMVKEKSLSDAETKLAETRSMLDASKKQLQDEEIKLEVFRKKAEAELANARTELNDSREELEKGQKDYEKAKQDSDKKISDTRKQIADAEDEIKKLEKPKWYVLDRNMNPGFVDYGNAADRMNAIAQVFPVFFFLVAALVCLTTMTRMVDEQRIYIGTFKGLGYSKASIASKYLAYAALASLSGSVFGFLVGFKVFPTVISNAYGIMYTLPPVVAAFNISYAVISTAFAVLTTTLAAWIACYRELAAAPAVLMRPKSPRPGKRVFLEKVKIIWSRLNFIQKITARNLLRYKKRFFMTVLGIGGCTALLLSGFGLKDSIMSIVTKQFDELYRYDMVVNFKNDLALGDTNSPLNAVKKDNRISDYMLRREQNIDISAGKNQKTVTLIVPESAMKLENFIILRERTTGKKIAFPGNGVILTEKLAKQLQVGIGDSVFIDSGETKKIPVKVTGITENYVSHYVYMPPELYKSIFSREVSFQQLTAKTTETSENFENKLSTDLMKNPDVGSIQFTTGISRNFKDIISSLNYIVLVLIFSAGALAFVVLYNLTNINVTERLREIATIKVLGFYDGEISHYVYRENVFLTLIGMGIGLVAGVFLHRFIVVTAEVDYVMFGRSIMPLSYVYSSVLTILFSAVVNLVMYFRLKSINMVESLKSVD